MNNSQLLLSLPAVMIIIFAAAIALIVIAVAAVLLYGKFAASGHRRARKTDKSESVFKTQREKSPKALKAQPAPQKQERPQEQPVAEAKQAEPVAVQPIIEKKPVAVKPVAEQPKEEEKPVAVEPTEAQPVEEQPKTEAQPQVINLVKAKPTQPTQNSEQPTKTSGEVLVRVRYNRSFTAKLIQSADAVKGFYSEVRSELERYPVKRRLSWKYESYKSGRQLIARLGLRGKTLSLYLDGDTKKYEGTKYKTEDVSAKKSTAKTPLLYRIKNTRRAGYSAQIIADVMAAHSLVAADKNYVDYAAQYPYEEVEPLIEKKLIKLLPIKSKAAGSEVAEVPLSELLPKEILEEVSVAEAESILPDVDVESLVSESQKYADRTRRGIVNIDALGKYFSSGETVTLDEIKKRVSGFDKKTTYIKVLARGKLDKTLYVEADDFSPAAVKMIVLTGGKATRTRTGKF